MRTGESRRKEVAEDGFTLTEVLVGLVVFGVLVTIAVVVLLGILEQRRVDAAAKQFAADLRLAHTGASNNLTDWRVVLMPDGSPVSGCSGAADYCLLKLASPYGMESSDPLVESREPRELPEGTRIKSVTFGVDCAGGDPDAVAPPSECGKTRTIEFNPNGTLRTLRPGLNGTVVISSEDGNPTRRVVFLAPTSRVRVQ